MLDSHLEPALMATKKDCGVAPGVKITGSPNV
jgi:hypothetical protein